MNSKIKYILNRFDNFIRDYRTLLLWFVLVLTTPNLLLLFTEPYSVTASIITVLLPLSFYGILLTISRKIGRAFLFCFPFLFLCAFQIVIMKLFHGSYIAVDMFTNLYTTSGGEAGELLGSLLSTIIFVVLYFGSTIVLSIYVATRKYLLPIPFIERWRAIFIKLFCVATVGGFAYQTYSPQFNIREHVFPVNVIENFVISVDREVKKNNYLETSANFSFEATKTVVDSTREVYVLIIGETSRANNFSLYGYNKKTNPQLERINDLVVAPDAISQCNTTHKIVPLLISSVTPEDFEDIYTQKSITTMFNEVGFDTYFISNQPPNGSFTDFFAHEANNSINLVINSEDGVVKPDNVMLKDIKKALNETNRNTFIVIHTYGSHFNYKARYSEEFRLSDDDDTSTVSAEFREQILNAYDNSIVMVDYFVAEVIKYVDELNTTSTLLYLSDHGEDVYDDKRGLFLHASPHPSYYQLHIPFVGWLSPEYRDLHPEQYANFVENMQKPINGEVIFHTLAQMASINSKYINSKQSLINSKFETKDRWYLNDKNESVLFYNSGIKQQDFEMFDKKGIDYDKSKVITNKI